MPRNPWTTRMINASIRRHQGTGTSSNVESTTPKTGSITMAVLCSRAVHVLPAATIMRQYVTAQQRALSDTGLLSDRARAFDCCSIDAARRTGSRMGQWTGPSKGESKAQTRASASTLRGRARYVGAGARQRHGRHRMGVPAELSASSLSILKPRRLPSETDQRW